MQQSHGQTRQLSKYDKLWNGVPCDSINWNPTVNEAASAIPLSVAVVLHEGATIAVVLNALRLLAWR